MREAAALLERHRLVTVTGSGRTGKTRLASEVARRMAGRFADGVWLAIINSGAQIGLSCARISTGSA